MEFQEFYDTLTFAIEDHWFGTMSLETFRNKMEDLFYETQVEEDKYKDEIEDLKADVVRAERGQAETEDELNGLKKQFKDAQKEIDRLEKILWDHDIDYDK